MDNLLWYQLGKNRGGGGSGGGGSGGTLPAGLYWAEAGIKSPTSSYAYFPFSLNGDLYSLIGKSTTVSKYLWDISKYVDGAWTKVVTDAKNLGSTIKGVEYNGKVHFLSYSTHHDVFDGTTYTAMTDLPGSTGGYSSVAFVHNGTLKYVAYNPCTVYAWDEATDTWTKEYEVSSSSAYTYWGVVNGEAYFSMSNASYKQCVYRYTGSSYELVCEDVSSSFQEMFGYNGCLYGTYYGTRTSPTYIYKLAKVNVSDGTLTMLGGFPAPDNPLSFLEYNGKVLCSKANGSKNVGYTKIMQFYEVEESE